MDSPPDGRSPNCSAGCGSKITGSPAKVIVQGFTALRYTNLIRDEVTGGVVPMSELDNSTSDWKHVKHYVYG